MTTINPQIAAFIEEYKSGQFTNTELANRHGVSLSTVSGWIRQSGMPRKPRGARPLKQPSPIHRQILELSAQLNGQEIAWQFGLTRQRVHQVLNRWRHLRPRRPEPPVRPTAERVHKKHRELRSQIVSFRLTAKQTDRVREALMTWGFGNRFSNSSASRAVLLAAVGSGRFNVPNKGMVSDAPCHSLVPA